MKPINTRLGAIRGNEHDGIQEFLGIRYAQPPVGERRFRKPQAAGPWHGTLDATQYGARAHAPPQPELLAKGERPVMALNAECAVAEGLDDEYVALWP